MDKQEVTLKICPNCNWGSDGCEEKQCPQCGSVLIEKTAIPLDINDKSEEAEKHIAKIKTEMADIIRKQRDEE